MARLFGTDGVRGLANRDLTAQSALSLAEAAARVLADPGTGADARRPLAVVGRDPRASGEFLSAAVIAGLAGSGVDVWDAGVIPTPAVSFLTTDSGADFGVVLSASHNPMPDNGIKFFGADGRKLPDDVEDRIEGLLAQIPHEGPTGSGVGRVRADTDAAERYIDHLVGTSRHDLSGLRVVVDTANGAASQISPASLRKLGAKVTELHTAPDGYNINEACGSTHMSDLCRAVVAGGADAGIAHDGDADRCLAVDATGQIVDGDQIMAILAKAWHSQGRLAKNSVVATVMSNLGFLNAMRSSGIEVRQTSVGDRYVLEEMLAGGYNLGGEQSGHVVMLDYCATGDGTLTAIQLLSEVAAQGVPLGELAAAMTRLPQVLVNVKDVDKAAVDRSETVAAALTEAETKLGSSGRVLLRPSGTEPLVRVMVEAPSQDEAREVADGLAAVIRDELSLPARPRQG
ncbi:MAG: phosphoglucosamine mutase [Candidatus Nanopelagicales bacterium]|nr:phosphoglucosamine mutase [Candidatus Nanopelagicales bacterium]